MQSAPSYTQLNYHYVRGICDDDTDCLALSDAVWAFAVTLNHSIEPFQRNGLPLSNYTYGKGKYTQIIRQQMYRLNFTGGAGRAIQFNPQDGYISSALTNVYTFKPPNYIVATYSFSDGLIMNLGTAVFVSTDFEEVHILVSLPLAAVFIVVDAIAALLVLGIHFVNTAYRHHKAIKASSTRLNHFAYAGCYLIILATLMHTITESFPVSIHVKSVLCNAFLWALSLGLTLVFGTVAAKTCRLYYIHRCALNFKKSDNVWMNDSVLAILIITMAALSVVLCTAWTVYDPHVRKVNQMLLASREILVLTTANFAHASIKFNG